MGVIRDYREYLEKYEDYTRMKPLCASRKAVFEFAEKCADNCKLQHGGDLAPIVKCNGGQFSKIDFYDMNEISGSIFVHEPHNFEIISPIKVEPAREQFTVRERFTIAHELGHFILHSGDNGKCWTVRHGTGQLEWEADWFAAGFLIPTSEIKNRIENGYGSIDSISSWFNVSYQVARARRKVYNDNKF